MAGKTEDTPAAETTQELKGILAALAALQEQDEGAQVIWRAKGPRNTQTTALAGILTVIDGARVVVIAQEFTRGSYALFKEFRLPKPDTAAE